MAPQRGAVVDGRGRGAAPPAAVVNRGVVARRMPSAAPAPVEQRQKALEADPGRPLNRAASDRLGQRTRPEVRQVNPQGGKQVQQPPQQQQHQQRSQPQPRPAAPVVRQPERGKQAAPETSAPRPAPTGNRVKGRRDAKGPQDK
ncbi:MAG: hypothetical protein ABIR70_10565 [Bryobacteraceae bacterium]